MSDAVRKHNYAFAVWQIVEVLPFGNFLKMYYLYADTLKIPDSNDTITEAKSLFHLVKSMRNAAAYSNCMLNQLSSKECCTGPPRALTAAYTSRLGKLNKNKRRLLRIPAM